MDGTGAELAAVVDEGNVLWCWSHPGRGADVETLADRFYDEEVARLSPPLRRGGHLSVVRRDTHWRTWRSYVAESFAGIYVLILWFDGSQELWGMRLRIHAVMPRIEALTVALPPPDGPDTSTGAGKLRA